MAIPFPILDQIFVVLVHALVQDALPSALSSSLKNLYHSSVSIQFLDITCATSVSDLSIVPCHLDGWHIRPTMAAFAFLLLATVTFHVFFLSLCSNR